jgi:hypothetical protein
MSFESVRAAVIALVVAGGALGCASAVRRFPLAEPVWHDPDRRAFRGEPEEYFSPFGWDAANQTFFRPVSRFFAVDPGGEATNVNALDEVPNSSWFQNRIGQRALSPEELVVGPCVPEKTDPVAPWTVTGAKPDGANPGFLIEDAEGKRYLVKFDGIVQGPRATAADVMVSKLYWAAGFTVPCNQVVFFDRSILGIDPKATSKGRSGRKRSLTEAHLDEVFSKAVRLPDGRYRASTSLFLPGKPLGPFTYQGTRDDDPNDVIPHEDRRELRGSRVLAAWVGHTDAREQNTLSMWIETGEGGGYVQHDVLDFGDCLGSLWDPPQLGRRIGHSNYFDFGHVGEDLVTFGVLDRPWNDRRFGPSGRIFGYFDVDDFDPDEWHPGYPNPAFSRMTEADAAWMARIISRFSDEHLSALAKLARFGDPMLEKEIVRILSGRRDRIFHRYLSRLSPLSHPTVTRRGSGAELCLRDLAVESGASLAYARTYVARAFEGADARPIGISAPHALGAKVCVRLPVVGDSPRELGYLIVDVSGGNQAVLSGPARVHLYALGGADYRVVGLERPEDDAPPG